jgi:hypothetical protein
LSFLFPYNSIHLGVEIPFISTIDSFTTEIDGGKGKRENSKESSVELSV